ncbi:MAG TPA: ATP-binding protein [Desulfuromonadaceae bacterium]|jgi:signal transduction histidine kinase
MKILPENHINGVISEDLLKRLAYNEKMAELGKISAGVVHELNAPLSVIISAAQLILREAGVPEYTRELVDRISSEAQRLSLLTRGLLTFSRQDEVSEETDINLAVEFVLNFLHHEAARRGVTVLRNLDHQLDALRMDSNTLKQILLNIIMNSLQAMEEGGGKLLVETSAPREGEISIVIADTGPGIAEELAAKIFEPYFTTKKPGEGTGLGLFVTRTLVENMGGRIELNSKPGEGATFIITLAMKE